VTVASFARNAGAGGVFLGLACDYAVAKEGVVLNPHYKTLGLSGSEYHTYTLEKRVSEDVGRKLLDDCLPISAKKAKQINIIDEVFSHDEYYSKLHDFSLSVYDENFLWNKEDYLDKNRDKIEAYKESELAIMHSEFWDSNSDFHKLRYEFVYKVCPRVTPKRFKLQKEK
jgi:putative two-component system hydrogenase maturation factor HypX/HoxX